MTALFHDLVLLDLSRGVAGPIATMMLTDRGMHTTRIDLPEPDPFEAMDQNRVWHRGKRRATLDLRAPADRDFLARLIASADVLVESFTAAEREEFGLDHATLAAINPRLIHCSITGYGDTPAHAGRPGIDQLVAARAGVQWEARGWYGSPMERILGRDRASVAMDVPPEIRIGADRDGPIFSATPAVSIIAAYNALLGISVALHARDTTGRGQHVQTSLLQAAIAMNCAGWQRPQSLSAPGYQFDVLERRQTWNIVEAADGFMCAWVSPPAWFAAAGAGDTLQLPADKALGSMRSGMLTIEQRLQVLAATAPIFKKFPVAEWVSLAAQDGDVSCQPVRTPEEALCDPALLAEGSVIEVPSPDLGMLRQVGAPYRLHARPIAVRWPPRPRDADTDALRAEAAQLPPVTLQGQPSQPMPAGPMAGIRIIDFGGAVAGPWATQLLADMGADVIKVDPARQAFWMVNHMGIAVNRSKRWIGLDAKTPDGQAIAQKLVAGADVVMLNLRPQAARKLGFDYPSLRAINPRLIYCSTRGFEDGPRSLLPGNDQTANALGGTEWEDGGCWHGGRPWFGACSNGDLGNGYLAAIGIVQALYDRTRTGEGQMVDASILNAALVNNSRVFTDPAGRAFPRMTLDADQTGFSALYRIYRCADAEWICLAALTERDWQALTRAIPDLAADPRFASAAARTEAHAALRDHLAAYCAARPAAAIFADLDGAGVPCEISSASFSRELFDNTDLMARRWTLRAEGNPATGAIDMFGSFIDFSMTPASPQPTVPVLWQHTENVLTELGYDGAAIADLAAKGAIILPAA